ncbi:phage tail-collar fiber domain-containing protein [Pseudomonas sp. OV226]|uniref:phage tail-collar fiber domain-containing protein n=1 Tax=Pseudomonas sp. OV226 TaxID=2135588 RepID=UPI000D6C814B|nr:phage tail protein [Pseudomonas sp. OV226]PWK31754.1 tail-collar fiber protein [Pseudomonas sp. OV226]
MVDVNSQFFAILTNVGMAKQANADALGVPWKITDMGVGDASGTDPIPSAIQTHLINEWRRRPLNQLKVDPANAAVIIAEQVIPADEGGKWIREIALYDADGDMVAVANCAPSFKPLLSQGSGRTQVVRMNFIVNNSGNITLKIDPAVVLATREYVDLRIIEELYKLDSKQSVRAATTANIALAGLQALDTVVLVAGDRVLVKNQNVAKDNGLYIAAAGVWTRAPDADISAEVTSALMVSVEQGATLADTRWQLVTDGVIVLGTTALTFQDVTQGYAPINSPALLGTPSAPTAPAGTNTTQIASTAFVEAVRVALVAADAQKAPLASPVLTGIPIANTAAPGTNTGQLATTAFVAAAGALKANLASPALTGLPTAPTPDTGVRGTAIATMQKFADEFVGLISANGYQKFPTGLIIQWGAGSVPANGGTTVYFPITFPNAGLNVVVSDQASSQGSVEPMGAQIIGGSAFQAWYKTAAAGTFYWTAIGY